jgi:alpha-L-rhamnosidase
MDVLDNIERPDAAYRIVSQESYPGWGYMLREGATTLWERWEKLEGNGMNSHNHIMLGSVGAWFYKTLAGIQCSLPAWDAVKIKPYIPEDMSHASGTVQTLKGIVRSSWEKKNHDISLTIVIPGGCKGDVWVPTPSTNLKIDVNGSVVFKTGKPAAEIPNFLFRGSREGQPEGYTIFSAAPGRYQVTVASHGG